MRPGREYAVQNPGDAGGEQHLQQEGDDRRADGHVAHLVLPVVRQGGHGHPAPGPTRAASRSRTPEAPTPTANTSRIAGNGSGAQRGLKPVGAATSDTMAGTRWARAAP